MTTGKKLISAIDNSGLAVFRTKTWGTRDYQSDRKKRIRKIISKKLRIYLKRELEKSITDNY